MKQGNAKTESVKAFIRQALGCDCDESVFEHIENERNVDAAGVKLRNHINVGGRLLVYVADAESADFVRSHLSGLLEAGRKERDARHFNRFRLVLATAGDGDIKRMADREFKLSKAVDEKVHMHIMNTADVAAL